MPTINSPSIPLITYRFYFETHQPVRLPDYPGSAWRGAFGHALKKTVCVVRNTPCHQCLLKHACAYSYVFETPPPINAGKMRKYTATPHPFVFRFAAEPSVEGFSFDLNLFGHGQRFFPYIIHAMHAAGQDGVGGHRQPFSLTRIDAVDFQGQHTTVYQEAELRNQPPAQMPLVPAMPGQIEITFQSPVRIKQEDKNLTGSHFSFGALFSALLRRISMISYFHTDTPLETNFAELTNAARTINFNSQDLHWYDWTRYSSRQHTEMQIGVAPFGRTHYVLFKGEEI